MVFTLHRYIFREVFKVFILAAVALTLMLSLGSILRPVAEYGVGPRQVIHLIGYFLPITLTFVLPMAALFAAALVYGRFANDNELDACRAGGISLLTLVYPGLALAIIVAIANLILSFQVVPAFVHRAEKALKADAKQILFRNIQRRGYYQLDSRFLIYADQANPQSNTLSGVVVTEVKDYAIERIITAERAKIRFNPHRRFNEVQIAVYNTYQIGADDQGWFSAEFLSFTMESPSLLGDDIKFKKIEQMKEIAADPMQFYPIEKLARQVYVQFTAELLAQDITNRIADSNNFYKLHSGRKFVEFTADRCSVIGEQKVELAGQIMVIEYDIDTKQPLRTLRAARALLHIEGDELAPTLTMEIYNPTWRRIGGLETLSQRQFIHGLILPTVVTNKLETADVLKAVSPASTAPALQKGPSAELTALQNKLHRKIQRTLTEIKAETHSRLIFGIGCVLLIVIGIGLGILLKGGHLLTAFGASSLPAAVLIICIMMGKNITKNPDAQVGSGLALMWMGLVLLSLLTAIIYRKLLKN